MWTFLTFSFNDPADFLTISSDHAESPDFVREEDDNPESSALNYQQGDNKCYFCTLFFQLGLFVSLKTMFYSSTSVKCCYVLFSKRHVHSDSLCFPDADRMEMETPALSETTLLVNVETAFALEPVAITRRHNQTTLKLCSFKSQMYRVLCKHQLRCCCCWKSWHQTPWNHHWHNSEHHSAKRAKPNNFNFQLQIRVTQTADSWYLIQQNKNSNDILLFLFSKLRDEEGEQETQAGCGRHKRAEKWIHQKPAFWLFWSGHHVGHGPTNCAAHAVEGERRCRQTLCTAMFYCSSGTDKGGKKINNFEQFWPLSQQQLIYQLQWSYCCDL